MVLEALEISWVSTSWKPDSISESLRKSEIMKSIEKLHSWATFKTQLFIFNHSVWDWAPLRVFRTDTPIHRYTVRTPMHPYTDCRPRTDQRIRVNPAIGVTVHWGIDAYAFQSPTRCFLITFSKGETMRTSRKQNPGVRKQARDSISVSYSCS